MYAIFIAAPVVAEDAAGVKVSVLRALVPLPEVLLDTVRYFVVNPVIVVAVPVLVEV